MTDNQTRIETELANLEMSLALVAEFMQYGSLQHINNPLKEHISLLIRREELLDQLYQLTRIEKTTTYMFFKSIQFELNTNNEIAFLTYQGNYKPWQKKLPRSIPIETVFDSLLTNDKVQDIYQSVCEKLKQPPSMVFVVVNHSIDVSAWLQILTFRTKRVNFIPIPYSDIFEGQENNNQRAILEKHLEQFMDPDYDLYDIRTPLADSLNFFGREEIANRLTHGLVSSKPVALFGVRKMGKTSLLKYLRQALPFPTAFANLQSGLELDELYEDIFASWQYSMSVKLPDVAWPLAPWQTSQNPTSDFVVATKQLLNCLANQAHPTRLCLLVDEIEALFPQDKTDDPHYLAFSSALRGLAQDEKNFSLLIAGRNAACVRTNLLQKVENPFYNLFREEYLPGLQAEDCTEMILNIGHQMDLRYEDEAVALIVTMSGGHPFMARQLCSLAFEKREAGKRQITLAHLEKMVDQFIRNPSKAAILDDEGLWGEVCHSELWSKAQIVENKQILRGLATQQPQLEQALFKQAKTRKAFELALYELKQRDILKDTESGLLINPLLFRNWIRRYELDLED